MMKLNSDFRNTNYNRSNPVRLNHSIINLPHFSRIIFSGFLIFSIFITTSCKKNKHTDVIPVRAPKQETLSPQDFYSAPKQETLSPQDFDSAQIDIDLTSMSSTMVLAEVFNMLIMPEEYEGKIVKANGPFLVFENPENNDRFYAILIEDATKCCQQGIEFVWTGNHTYPDDYPIENQKIVVTGVYHTIEYDTGVTYNYLEVFDLQK